MRKLEQAAITAYGSSIRVVTQTQGSVVVGHQLVHVGTAYRFTLPPGRYIIDRPHYMGTVGGKFNTGVSVIVKAGTTVDADLPNPCI
jgi:hypothetical protein